MGELVTGRPIFSALDENELLEFIMMIVDLPNKEMIDKAKKKSKFFDKDYNLIRSKQSRLQNAQKKSFPIKQQLSTIDTELIDFIEVFCIVNCFQRCLEITPALRMTPEEALKHPWLDQ